MGDIFEGLRDPLPGDLMVTFGQSAAKYGFQEAIFYVEHFRQMVINNLSTSTLYVAKCIE